MDKHLEGLQRLEKARRDALGTGARGASMSRREALARLFSKGALVLPLLGSCPAQAEVRRPEEVKAAFLYKFTRFVEWPASAFESPESPFILGVVDGDAIANHLEVMVRNERVQNRPLVLRRHPAARLSDGAVDAHVLYLDVLGRSRLERILRSLKGRPILTVGESRDFLSAGGMIGFVIDRTIGLRIHLARAREAGLTISSQLLRLAEIENE